MKKALSVFLCILILAVCSTSVFALEKIAKFDVSVKGFEIGNAKSKVDFTFSDNRLEITNKNLTGEFGADDTILEQQRYTAVISVKIKDGVKVWFPDEFEKGAIRLAGSDVSCKITFMEENNKRLVLTFTLTTDKSAKTISDEKEAEEAVEARKHKHCYCGGYIEIGDHTSHTVVTYRAWDGKSKIAYDGSGNACLYITEDVVLGSTLNIGGGKTLTLCLNGHSITMGTGNDRVINVGVGGKLILCNCTREGTAQIRGGYAEYGAGIHNNGTVEMYGGVITQNEGGYGGGVYNNTNFYLYGGDIYNNEALYGGGVWNDNDSTTEFIMYEGTITLNTASCGGGIWSNDGATLLLKGGDITLNVAGTGGGAVWNNGKANVEVDGVTIIENSARYGGGMWNNGGFVSIKSGYISKNMATTDPAYINGNGGGIWNNGGVINMTGGEITFNKAYLGGGVWCNDDSEFIMSGGVIAENEADVGAGIYVQRSDDTVVPGRFRLTGKAGIVMNYSATAGGGAYIKGILETEGEAEITLNECIANAEYADYVAESCAELNINYALPTQFIDVDAGAYYLEPVRWAVGEGITSGTSNVTFSPDDKCTRGQVITFLYRMHGSPETDGFYFADTNPSDYFYDATRWARELKMESGASFSPNHNCSRAAAIRYMWIAAGSPKLSAQLPFTDIPQDANYRDAVAWALEKGITSGTTATTFSPNDYCTRAQIVTFLYRAFK